MGRLSANDNFCKSTVLYSAVKNSSLHISSWSSVPLCKPVSNHFPKELPFMSNGRSFLLAHESWRSDGKASHNVACCTTGSGPEGSTPIRVLYLRTKEYGIRQGFQEETADYHKLQGQPIIDGSLMIIVSGKVLALPHVVHACHSIMEVVQTPGPLHSSSSENQSTRTGFVPRRIQIIEAFSVFVIFCYQL